MPRTNCCGTNLVRMLHLSYEMSNVRIYVALTLHAVSLRPSYSPTRKNPALSRSLLFTSIPLIKSKPPRPVAEPEDYSPQLPIGSFLDDATAYVDQPFQPAWRTYPEILSHQLLAITVFIQECWNGISNISEGLYTETGKDQGPLPIDLISDRSRMERLFCAIRTVCTHTSSTRMNNL